MCFGHRHGLKVSVRVLGNLCFDLPKLANFAGWGDFEELNVFFDNEGNFAH